uniref:Ig-like domain-containing protein n=1 Tax=Ornithorhynchus anatinus TaxID=9258 RepID=A0A6I8NBT9_ORNAN
MSPLSLWLIAIWLLALKPRSGFTASTELTGVKGGSVQLFPEIPAGKEVNNIIWNSPMSFAIINPGTTGTPPEVVVTDSRYKGRVRVLDQSYILHISDLKMEDAGYYIAQINLVGVSDTFTRNYTLRIFEPLPKPKITRKISRGENNTCNFTLTCSVVGGGANITYSWSSPGPGAALSPNSSVLRVSRSPEDDHTHYTCTATNSITSSYEIVDSDELLCPAPLHSPLKIGVSSLAVLIALAGAFVGYLLFRKKTWKGTNKPQGPKNPEPAIESRVYDEVGLGPAKDLPDRDGNTLYFHIKPSKLVSKPDPVKESAVNTIYSVVEIPKRKPPPTAAKTDALPYVLPTEVKAASSQRTGVAAPEKSTDKCSN